MSMNHIHEQALVVNLVLFYRDTPDGQGCTQAAALANTDAVPNATGAAAGIRVLLIRRLNDPFAGRWALPGGWAKPGEHIHDAARRYARAATGVDIMAITLDRAEASIETMTRKRKHADFFDEPGRDPRGRAITVTYAAFLRAMPLADAHSDAVAASWMRLPTALNLDRDDLAFDHYETLTGVAHRWTGKPPSTASQPAL